MFQWGCGRACGNIKRNILFPEEVTVPSLPVKYIAAGCWHCLLLTDGGNVFSWGMGQEGQLGLGEDRIHISTPCLLSYSQLTGVTQIQAGDSYSAAITAGGELLLWGQIHCLSRVSDHTGLKRIWTPQPVPLAGRKVCDVACGSWHMMALTTCSHKQNGECPHPETEARFRNLVSNPVLMEHTEKENTDQPQPRSQASAGPVSLLKARRENLNRPSINLLDSRKIEHKSRHRLESPEDSEEQEKESKRPEEEERHEDRPKKDEEDGALHNIAFAKVPEMDSRGNDQSSIKSDQAAQRERCRTAGPWELRKGPCRSYQSRDVVFTSLHLLPRLEGEQYRTNTGILPRLLTGHQAQSRAFSEAGKGRSVHLTEVLPKSGSESSILPGPRLRPQPELRLPGRCPAHAEQRVVSIQRSRNEVHTDMNSPVYNSSPYLSAGQPVQMSFSSFQLGPQVKTSLFLPTPSSSEPLRHSPTPNRAVYSSRTFRKKH
ncbi:uncharacterized protein LOC132974123 [Labrus mixtus]|uniref:uncharacterized protein LOC132974123 n=1 Tax=Labrus mixtus TaxID=508554 RepID=UPI0029C0BB4B|nr:uncharacterized protein LOC132974123 [Labrus mixtus]